MKEMLSRWRSKEYLEIYYLLYFALMAGAKSMGLIDGELLYKVILVIGFGFIGLKLILSQNTKREWLFILFSIGLGGIVYYRTGEKGLLICLVTMAGMKGVRVHKVFKVGAFVWAIGMNLNMLLALTGLRDEGTYIVNKAILGTVTRHDLGFSHPNTLGMAATVTVMFVLYALKDRLDKVQYMVATVLAFLWSAIVFFMSFSVTSMVATLIFLTFNTIAYLNHDKKPSRVLHICIQCVLPACVLFSIIVPVLLYGTSSLDWFKPILAQSFTFQHRMVQSFEAITEHPILPIGTRMVFNAQGSYETWFTIDSSYVWLLVQYGFIAAIYIFLIYFGLIRQYVIKNKKMELAIILALLIAGVSEPLLFNTSFKNPIFIFAGDFMYQFLNKEKMVEVCNGSFVDGNGAT